MVSTRQSDDGVAGAVPEAVASPGRLGLLLGILFGLAGSGSAAAAVVLPALAGELNVSAAASAWVLSGYALTLAVATAVHGRLADLVGIRLPLVVGVLLMVGGAALAALAPSFGVLLAARLVQGLGAAAIPVLALALLSARFDGTARAAALGRLVGVTAAITALGPLAGGALAGVGGWRPALALPVAGLLLLPVIWRHAPRRGSGLALDVRGAVVVTATATGLVLLIQSPTSGVTVAVVGFGLLIVGAPLVGWHVRRRPDGFLPRSVVTSAVLVRSSMAAAVVPAAWFALLVAVPLSLADRGWSPLGIGLLLVPSAVTGLAASRGAGPLLARIGSIRSLAVAAVLAGIALATAALGALIGAPVLLLVGVALVTVAFGLGQPALVDAVSGAAPAPQRGVALGSATLVFLVGGGVGAAAVGGLGDLLGLPGVLLVLAALPIGGLLGLLPLLRRPPLTPGKLFLAAVSIRCRCVRRVCRARLRRARGSAASARRDETRTEEREIQR